MLTKQTFLQRFNYPRRVIAESDFPLRKAGKPASVLIPIVERDDQLKVLFTERAKHLKHHAGQVSFPGGKQEPSDCDLIHTALRETHEEIGLSEDRIEIVGSLPKYRTVSRFEVLPLIGFVAPPFELKLDTNEVESCFEVPLSHILNQDNHLIHWVHRQNYSHPIYFIPWQDKQIWGATAAFVRMLSNHFAEHR